MLDGYLVSNLGFFSLFFFPTIFPAYFKGNSFKKNKKSEGHCVSMRVKYSNSSFCWIFDIKSKILFSFFTIGVRRLFVTYFLDITCTGAWPFLVETTCK